VKLLAWNLQNQLIIRQMCVEAALAPAFFFGGEFCIVVTNFSEKN
jgi:hypothetical protein